MKTSRRQELRTNELSEQIGAATEYIRRNAAVLAVIVVSLGVVVGGGYWFIGKQQTELSRGWAALEQASTGEAVNFERIEEIAESGLSEALTVQALLQMGDLTIERLPTVTDPDERKNWLAKAESAYERIRKDHASDTIALGHALIGLGIVAENRGDIETAREWYNKVVNDARLANTPLRIQADFRLASLDDWSVEITFPPPKPEEPAISPTTQPSEAPVILEGTSQAPETPTATTEPAAGPAPMTTTQPATPESPTAAPTTQADESDPFESIGDSALPG